MTSLQGFVTPPTRPPRGRLEGTRAQQQHRCAHIPAAWHSVWHVPHKADFRAFSNLEAHVVMRWLIGYVRRTRAMAVAPLLTVDRDTGELVHDVMLADETRWYRRFVERVVGKRELGLAPFGFYNAREGHATLCLVDARPMRRTKGRIDLYFVDPNGTDAGTRADMSLYRMATRHLRERLQELYFLPHRVQPIVRATMLNVPPLNSKKSHYMRTRDFELGLHIRDENDGFCALWTYALILDVVCAPDRALSRDHFARLHARAGGDDPDPRERDYARLQFLRALLTWMTRRMFDRRDPHYAELVRDWDGPRVFADGVVDMIPYVVRRASSSFV
jgi:hypothetical protein